MKSPDVVPVSLTRSSTTEGAVFLASGLSVGFLLGWFLRSRSAGRTSFGVAGKLFGNAATVGKYAVTHGKIPRTKLALIVRSDLEMSKGKVAAQCGHAAVGTVQNFTANPDLLKLWFSSGQAKVVLKVLGEQEMLHIAKRCEAAGISTFLVRDAGRTEVEPGSATVLAVGPAEVEAMDTVTGTLKLL